jgi:hypothetical protein
LSPSSFHRHQANGQAGGVKLQHHRRQGAGRQALQVGQREVGEFRHVRVGVRPRLKIDFDNADSQHRARLHVINAAGQGEEAFERVGDVDFDVLGRHAGVKRRHHHFRQINGRKKVDGHAHQAGDAQHQQHQTTDHDEIRITD